MNAKTPPTVYTSSTTSQSTNWLDFIGKEAIKALVPSAFTAGLMLVAMYFWQLSIDSRVSAVESTYVRQDVLMETLTPMKNDIIILKEDSSDIKTDVGIIKGILQGSNN